MGLTTVAEPVTLSTMTLTQEILTAASCGLVVGGTSSLFGIGGGILMVPIFYVIFSLQGFDVFLSTHMATATSLAVIVFTSAVGSWHHLKNGYLQWHRVGWMIPGAAIGISLALLLRPVFKPLWIHSLFSIMLIGVGVKFLMPTNMNEDSSDATPYKLQIKETPFRKVGYSIIGFAGGFIGTLLGVGGGTINVPALHFGQKLPLKEAIANSLGLIFFISLFATAYNGWSRLPTLPTHRSSAVIIWGWVRYPWVLTVAPFSMLSSYVAALYLKKMPVRLLRISFGILTVIMGFYLWSKIQR